jgi:hypothetical protein
MSKFKFGKRDEIKFLLRVPQGEAGEMLEAITKIADDKEACIFLPFAPKEKEEIVNRYRARIANWRNSGRIPIEIGVAVTEDNQIAIYHRLMKKKPGRPAGSTNGSRAD